MTTISQPSSAALAALVVPPKCWTRKGSWGPHGDVWEDKALKLTVVRTVAGYDGREWVHVSASHKHRCPSRAELAEVKVDFLGDVWACQVMPPRLEHVNIHPNCLHIWSPADGVSPLPDFTCGSGSI
jgi:hypothetical protein